MLVVLNLELFLSKCVWLMRAVSVSQSLSEIKIWNSMDSSKGVQRKFSRM